MTDPTQAGALRRHVLRARHRHTWWMALCGGLTANALLVLALWASSPRSQPPPPIHVMPAQALASTPTPPSIVVPPAPLVVVVPAAAPAPPTAAFGDLGPCPAVYTARPAGRLAQPTSDDEVRGVAGAPTDSRWIVAWTTFHLHVSRDGGASWDRVLDGPGLVLDASFDCHGRVLALRAGTGLGLRDGNREAWRAVPGLQMTREPDEDDLRYMPRLVGGGRRIAVVGSSADEIDHAQAAMSDDGGVSWSHADLSWYEGEAILAAWDGDLLRIAVPWTDCMSEGVRLVTVGSGGVRVGELDEHPGQVGMDRGKVIGVGGYGCAVTKDASRPATCTWREGRGWRWVPLPGASVAGEDAPEPVLVDGPTDVVLFGDTVHALGGSRAGRARPWDAAWTPLGTDLAGRLWGRDGYNGLVRR